MQIKSLAFVLLAASPFGVACSKDKKNKDNAKSSEIKLRDNASQYQDKVVPNDFVNTKGSLGETKAALVDQADSVKGPGAQLGIDSTSTPRQLVTNLTSPGLMSRSVRSFLNSRETFPPTVPSDLPRMPPPQTGSGNANKSAQIDMTSCDSFFGNVDKVIESALGGVKSSLAQVNEDDIVGAKGITRGEKASNEAFNYRMTVAENGTTMTGTFSGGANDTSAFVKGSAIFGGTFTMQTEEGESDINTDDLSGGQQLSASPAPSSQPTEPVTFTGKGMMSASVFVDSSLSMLKVGGGVALDGKLGNDPVSFNVASFVELAGGKSPKIAVDLEAEGFGKMPGSSEPAKVASDFHLSMTQNAEMGIRAEVKSAGSYISGGKVENLGFTVAADFNVIKGQCVVQNITCSADQAEKCKSIEGWKAE